MTKSMNRPAGGVRRFTVSLPADLFERGERERRRRHEQRSQFVAGMYRRYLQDAEDRERVARYAAAYSRLPETPEEQWLVEQSLAELASMPERADSEK